MNAPRFLFTALLLAAAPAPAADSATPPTRPKDAAEAVQEGNVRNWVEYYERSRKADRPANPPAPPASPPATEPPKR